MTEHTDSHEHLDKDTEVLKEIADQVEQERESGATAFDVPEDDQVEQDESDEESDDEGPVPPAVSATGR